MKQRILGNTGISISEIGLGTWQLGTRWGETFNETEARSILDAAQQSSVTVIDTADVYNGGNSERAIGAFLKTCEPNKKPFVITKAGRKLDPHIAAQYTPENITTLIEGSLTNMTLEQLDMVLLHCPPTDVYQKDALFTALDYLKQDGKIASYGVSVEKVSEGLQALAYNISAIEVIFNMFRLKPAEELFPKAQAANVGIIARVPLASGLLTGQYSANTTFAAGDHRTFNRNGERFDKGETFSGVPYDIGLQAAQALQALFGTDDLAPYALRWILMHDAVSTVIPGASKTQQLQANLRAANLPPLTIAQMDGVANIYNHYLKETIHPYW
ncbi:MAG: aldo/keto reductase [Faecalibacterium sp.]